MRLPSWLCFWAAAVAVGVVCNQSIASEITSHDDVTVEVQIAQYEAEFLQEFVHYQATGRTSANFDRLLDLINSPIKVSLDLMPNATNPKMCLTCLALSHTFLELYKDFRTNQEKLQAIYSGDDAAPVQLAKQFCQLISMKNFVCEGIVDLNADVIRYVLRQMPQLPTAEALCEIAYQGENCVATGSNILTDKYPKVNVSSSSQVLEASKGPSAQSPQEPLSIIHITDIHYDPGYTAGINAACGAGTCCRPLPDLEPADSTTAAGFWGDYRDCDSPWYAVVDVMEQIRSQHPKIDAVYFTGDVIHHFVWNTTWESNRQSLREVFQLLKERFPGIPLYPILGNHEAHPTNLYAPSDVPAALSSKYLYDYIAEEWMDWLPDESAQATIVDSGYYTVLSPLGYRIIGLNSNFCYVHNWWLLYRDDYFIPQLQWLHDTLAKAEATNEKVHILGHVPSNDDYCYVGWTREYRKIVERFAHIIQAQFNGHSHFDEFNVFYKKGNPSAAVSVAWNGGSTTTFTELNPNYKLFYVDRESFEVLDQETWIYNLTEANQHPDRKPAWFKEYSFKEQYGLDDLSPRSLDGLLHRFSESENELLMYWKLKQKHADPPLAKGCDKSCLRGALCALARTEFGDDSVCQKLLNQPQK